MKAIALASVKKRKLAHATAESSPDSESPIKESDQSAHLEKEPEIEEKEEAHSPPKFPTLTWKDTAEKSLRQTYGKGSRSTTKRERKKARELQEEAKKSRPIQDVWKREVELGLGAKNKESHGELEKEEEDSSSAVSTPLISL